LVVSLIVAEIAVRWRLIDGRLRVVDDDDDVERLDLLDRIRAASIAGAPPRCHHRRIRNARNDRCIIIISHVACCPFPPPLFHTSSAAAFVPQQAVRTNTELAADRRAFLAGAAAVAAAAAIPSAANAVRDYENVGLLGGSEIIDINNANVRAYLKLPGMYPNAAGKIASNGPYNAVSEIYNIPGLTSREKDILKKYEGRFVTKTPSADYVIDRINNGLYK
jgi:photosystem II PsbU protein